MQPQLLTAATFEDCNPAFPSLDDHADNYISNVNSGGIAHSGNCSAGIGLNGVEYGKLLAEPFAPSTDVWFSGWVYFAPQFALPQLEVPYNGQTCNMGVHIWRLYDSVPPQKLHMDFNIPAGLNVIQLLFFQYAGVNTIAQTFVKWTSFQPTSQALSGTWQYWQVHINLGTPGNNDGFMRFYANNQFVDSMENQPFLPSDADDSWAFQYADLQSNISIPDGCSGAWPTQNGWYVDDVRICANGSC